MSLPTLNETLTNKATLPISKIKVEYRAFVGKEEKILLTAAESESVPEIFEAIGKIISNCTAGIDDVWSLPVPDVEFLFIRLRMLSVGSTKLINYTCENCGHEGSTSIDLNKISVTKNGDNLVETVIDKAGGVSIELYSPEKFSEIMSDDPPENMSETEEAFYLLQSFIRKVITEDKIFEFQQEPLESRMDFIESFSADQRQVIADFVSQVPSVTLKDKYVCENCSHENDLELRGLQNFF